MFTSRRPAVLIVENERIVAMDLQETLNEMGYDAYAVACSAEEAVARASERCPDVVLMDIRIEGERDGIEAAAILRERFGVPIVYLTAYADEATVARANNLAEPHGYLLKPVDSARLRTAIEVSLTKHTMEKRLRARERWFSTTLHSIADAVITVDLAGKVTFMNPAAEALTGTSLAEGVGRSAREVVPDLDGKAGFAAEGRRPDAEPAIAGTAKRIVADSAPVVDEGEVLGAVMVFRDTTGSASMIKERELADRMQSLGTMAAGVAHQVNNPLAVVIANASFVVEEMGRLRDALRTRGDGQHADLLRLLDDALQAQTELQASASRIVRMVGDLKVFSRPADGSAGEADVARAIEWASRAIALELRDRARLTIQVAPQMPAARADETRLGQVLINILTNAAQAIPPGNVEGNTIAVVADMDEKGRIVIEVRDTGGGMPPEVLARMFEPFFTTRAVGVGTGLGLSICHGILTPLGGEIQAESVVGKGTTLRILLPAVDASRPTVTAAVPRSEKALRGRILVIDDEDMVRRALKRILRDHEPVCIETGREALDLIARGEKFDFIFSDVTMPTMTGIEFYEILRARNPELARRVVFLTGGAITLQVEQFLRSIPNLRIEKPFEVLNLLDTVQQLLGKLPAATSA